MCLYWIQLRINLWLSFPVCVAAALVIVSEVADQANDNLKQGVSLVCIQPMCSLHSETFAPVEFDVVTAQRCHYGDASLYFTWQWKSNFKMDIKREEVRQLKFFCVWILLLNDMHAGVKERSMSIPPLAMASAACWLTQWGRGKLMSSESPRCIITKGAV